MPDFETSRERKERAEYDARAPSEDLDHAATRFHPQEAAPSQYERFDRYQRHQEESETGQQYREFLRRRDAETWCARLELKRTQRRRVLHLVDRVDFTTLNGYHYAAEDAILAIIVHVAIEGGREPIDLTRADGGDDVDATANSEELEAICEIIETDASELLRVREILREEIEDVGPKNPL